MCICKMGRQWCLARATFWKSAAVVSIRFMDPLKDMLSSGTYMSGISVPVSDRNFLYPSALPIL